MSYLLLENGDQIELEDGTGAILLESGSAVVLIDLDPYSTTPVSDPESLDLDPYSTVPVSL